MRANHVEELNVLINALFKPNRLRPGKGTRNRVCGNRFIKQAGCRQQSFGFGSSAIRDFPGLKWK